MKKTGVKNSGIILALMPAMIGVGLLIYEKTFGCTGSMACVVWTFFLFAGWGLIGLSIIILFIMDAIKESKKRANSKPEEQANP